MQSVAEMQADFNSLQLDINRIHYGLAAIATSSDEKEDIGFSAILDIASKHNVLILAKKDVNGSVLALLSIIRVKMEELNAAIRHRAEIDRIGHVPARMLVGEPPLRDYPPYTDTADDIQARLHPHK